MSYIAWGPWRLILTKPPKKSFSFQPWVRKTNVHHWRLMPPEGCNFTYNFFTCMHASVSRTLTARLLRGCFRCNMTARSKEIPHPPNENAPPPKKLPSTKKYMKKTRPLGLHVWDMMETYDSTNSHISTRKQDVNHTPLRPTPWSEMYECSHLLCPRLAIRDACLKYPQKKTWHKSTSLCCQKESSQDAEKNAFFCQEIMLWFSDTNVAAIIQIEISTRLLGKYVRNKLDSNRNQWKVHSSWAHIGMNFRSWWTR